MFTIGGLVKCLRPPHRCDQIDKDGIYKIEGIYPRSDWSGGIELVLAGTKSFSINHGWLGARFVRYVPDTFSEDQEE